MGRRAAALTSGGRLHLAARATHRLVDGMAGRGPKPACRQAHPLSRWESQARDGCARAACLCSASPNSSGCRPNQCMQGDKCRAVGGARRSRPAARRKSPIAESAPARNFLSPMHFHAGSFARCLCAFAFAPPLSSGSRPVLALQPDSMQMQGPPGCGNIGRSVGILPSSPGRPMRSPAARCIRSDGCARAACLCSASPNSSAERWVELGDPDPPKISDRRVGPGT